ncbi:hypothetical protein ACFQY4_13475 [Catellatospora bangladeshensis]|uniref:Uncharacterized protein n=1 Tax=Catellatospora bangladeshensis TaxID=310355 RepID=A0A8J3JWI5_9ACTN|nr:hypothetical protein [Catellatospora bangladeshensis]GIF84979.1 hypothetical protein Cba03nite_63280 [Catellatospora bangladeshensis]
MADGKGVTRPVPGEGETAVSVALMACLALAVVVIGLFMLVPDLLGKDRGLKLAGIVMLVGLGPQAIRYVMGRRRGTPARRRGRLLRHLFQDSPFWLINWWLVSTLVIGGLLWLLVPADWVEAWFCVALFCVIALDADLARRGRRSLRAVPPGAGE